MQLQQKYLDAIKNKDTLRLQMMLVTIIYGDEGFNTNRFVETFQAIKEVYPEIVVPHEGIIISDKTKWNEDYYNQSLAALRGNFSEERINHVMEIGRYLHGKPKVLSSQSNNIDKAKSIQKPYKQTTKPQRKMHVNDVSPKVGSLQSNNVDNAKSIQKDHRKTTTSQRNMHVNDVSPKKIIPAVLLTGAAVLGGVAMVKSSIPLAVGAIVVGGAGIYTLQEKNK